MMERQLSIEGVLLEFGRCTLAETMLPTYFPEYKMLNSAKTVELLSIKGSFDPSFDRNSANADTQPINSHRTLSVLQIDKGYTL